MIPVYIDPRVEFINALQYVSGEDERLGDILFRPGNQKLISYFDQFLTDSLVEHYLKMVKSGFSYDAPHNLLQYYSWPQLELKSDLPTSLIQRAGGKKSIEVLIHLLKDTLSPFDTDQFKQIFKPPIQDVINRVKNHLTKFDIENLFYEFFQRSEKQFGVILSEQIIGGYSLSICTNKVNSLISVDHCKDLDDLNEYILHEFCHAFVNPMGEEYSGELSKFEPLFCPIQKQMEDLAYTDWSICWNEHIVRSITVLMHKKIGNVEFAEQQVQSHIQKGFIYIEEILKEMQSLSNGLRKFEDIYPELISQLALQAHYNPRCMGPPAATGTRQV